MESQVLQRLKPYKVESPLKTINKIRNILNDLDFFTIESHIVEESDFHSCRIYLDNESIGLLNIATNGKGMTREYSLASGYAEFLERLQNNAKLHLQNYQSTRQYLEKKNINGSFRKRLEENGLIHEFRFAPDEQYSEPKNSVESVSLIYKNLFKSENQAEILEFIKNDLHLDKIETLPFYTVNSDSIANLPIRLIQIAAGTNGMCSGNTKIEAIIQGISEIFERYAICMIYQNELTPPTIPLEVFKGNEIYNRILKLQEQNRYSFIIKDCSLNIELPVLGALIIDHQNNSYTFHIGADPCPITALERCFTEVYQGGKSARFKNLHILSDEIFRYMGEKNNKSRGWNKLNQMYKTIKDGTGLWPDSIFSTDFSYQFNGFENPISRSNESDLEYILSVIKRNNYNLYIRDQSYLGFDSFYIYISEISNIYNLANNDIFSINYGLENKFSVLANINNSSEKSIEETVEILEKDYNHPSYDQKDIRWYFLANTSFRFFDMKPELLLVMLFYRVKDYNKSLKYLKIHIDKSMVNSTLDYTYLFGIVEYLKLKIKNFNDADIRIILNNLFSEKMSDQVISDMRDPEKVFKYHKLPTCFDCDNCQVTNDCKYFDLLRFYKKLRKKNVESCVSQNELSILFTNLKI